MKLLNRVVKANEAKIIPKAVVWDNSPICTQGLI